MTHLGRLVSFLNAFRGIGFAFATQTNIKIHTAATVLVVIAGFFFNISLTEWMLLALCIAAVVSAELFNTAIEIMADHFCPHYHTKVRRIKDCAAGAVLVTSAGSAVTGLLIFVPKIIAVFH